MTELIGEGWHRRVFAHPDDPGLVVKRAKSRKARDHNLRERDVWAAVCDRPEGQYLAAVVDCAPDGAWLLQERLVPLGPMCAPWLLDHDPKITDVNTVRNYGLRGGRPILLDYATPGVLAAVHERWG